MKDILIFLFFVVISIVLCIVLFFEIRDLLSEKGEKKVNKNDKPIKPESNSIPRPISTVEIMNKNQTAKNGMLVLQRQSIETNYSNFMDNIETELPPEDILKLSYEVKEWKRRGLSEIEVKKKVVEKGYQMKEENEKKKVLNAYTFSDFLKKTEHIVNDSDMKKFESEWGILTQLNISIERKEEIMLKRLNDFMSCFDAKMAGFAVPESTYFPILKQPIYVEKIDENNIGYCFDEEIENIDIFLSNYEDFDFNAFELRLIEYLKYDEIGIAYEINVDTNVSCDFDIETGVLELFGEGPMPNYIYFEKTFAPWYEFRNLIKKVVIKNGITTVGMGAFVECDNLIEVELSNTIEKICEGGFWYSVNIEKINIPESVKFIGSEAFYGLKNKNKIVIPDSIEEKENVFGEDEDYDEE